MAEYTVVNLKEVEDQAPKFGFGPDMEARFATGELGLTRSGVSYQRLAPGFRQPFGHSHGEQEELYVLLSGGLRAKIDDELVELAPLDALRVPPQATRQFEAGPEGAELLAFGAPNTGPVSQDAEVAPGWWAD